MQEAPPTIDKKTVEHQGSDISELPRKPRVSIFVESINGFGHFNVAKEIGKALMATGVDVQVVSSTASSDYAKFDFGEIEHVRLPSLKMTCRQ